MVNFPDKWYFKGFEIIIFEQALNKINRRGQGEQKYKLMILYSNLLCKKGQDFLDTQYVFFGNNAQMIYDLSSKTCYIRALN